VKRPHGDRKVITEDGVEELPESNFAPPDSLRQGSEKRLKPDLENWRREFEYGLTTSLERM
jgi:hypothetical protein